MLRDARRSQDIALGIGLPFIITESTFHIELIWAVFLSILASDIPLRCPILGVFSVDRSDSNLVITIVAARLTIH